MMDKLIDAAGHIGGQRHLAAVRDGLVSLAPLMILGSFVTLLGAVPDVINTMAGTSLALPGWLKAITGAVWWGTIDMLALLVVFSVAHNLARFYDSDSLAAALVAEASYLSVVPQTITAEAGGSTVELWGNMSRQYTNANGMFVGIIVALVSTEIFIRLSHNKRLLIRMPAGTPPAVSRSFSALIPGAAAVLAVAAVFTLVDYFSGQSAFEIVHRFLAAHIRGVADTLPWALGMALLVHLFWFFGLHGTNLLGGIIEPIMLTMTAENIEAFVSGSAPPNIITKTFMDIFVYIGGAGTSLGLVLAILIAGRSARYRSMAKLAIAPSLFNINETILFGFPIVLNPAFVVPFILAPLATAATSYFALALGLVPKTVAIIHWATPPVISGLLATGGAWQAAALQLFNIAVSTLIYLPFVRVACRDRDGEAVT